MDGEIIVQHIDFTDVYLPTGRQIRQSDRMEQRRYLPTFMSNTLLNFSKEFSRNHHRRWGKHFSAGEVIVRDAVPITVKNSEIINIDYLACSDRSRDRICLEDF